MILRRISQGESIEEIVKVAKVSPMALGKVIATLQLDGYISADGRLTEKGLREAGA